MNECSENCSIYQCSSLSSALSPVVWGNLHSLFAASAISFAAQERLVLLSNHNMKAKSMITLNITCASECYVMVRTFAMLPAPTCLNYSVPVLCHYAILSFKRLKIAKSFTKSWMTAWNRISKYTGIDQARWAILLLVMKTTPAQKSLRSLQNYSWSSQNVMTVQFVCILILESNSWNRIQHSWPFQVHLYGVKTISSRVYQYTRIKRWKCSVGL